MALWICGRPPEKCHPAEVHVAERLSRLSDDWIVSWGFRYGTGGGTEPEREGDFVVQSPTGHVCVLEVKSGRLRQFALTGFWESSNRDNPAEQLNAEWQGVIALLEMATTKLGAVPLVHRALALPNVTFVGGDRFSGHLSRSQLLDQSDLEKFSAWWNGMVAKQPIWISAADARQVFVAAFGRQVAPKAVRFFVNETDSLILRQLEAESELLDVVAGNRQLLIEGGCGSGKTFLAVEQARRWADQDTGKSVLLLCYNLPLAEQLAQLVARLAPKRGSITVMSWEALAAQILLSAGIPFSPPKDSQHRWSYFTVEVPGLLLAIGDDNGIPSVYDALVVDEGQDHDTIFPAELARPDLPGWWTFYLRLLHRGPEANIAVFHDTAQRPRFRARDGFSAPRLAAALSQPAFLHLPRAVRYTRPVFEYLDKIRPVDALRPGEKLRRPFEFREGPAVEEYVVRRSETGETVAEIAERWITRGFCHPHDILILGQRRDRGQSSLAGLEQLGRWPVCDFSATIPPGSIPYLNVHRAKGLDRLAIILIDLPPFSTLQQIGDLDRMDALFAGASRARQLLAIVAVHEAGQ
jgi:hypothetical protein